MRYDNLSLAVTKILRGYQREQTERFVAFRSHWGFDSEFCNPSRGNEKGGVESEVGYFRRNYLTPVPAFSNWDELNEYLLSCCLKDATRHISGKGACCWNDASSRCGAALRGSTLLAFFQFLPTISWGFFRDKVYLSPS